MSKEKLTDVSSVLRAAAAAKAEYLSNNSWITSLFTAARATKIRILIVADGKIDFKDSEFGLSELCSSLAASSTPQEQFEITTAHRSTVDTGAQIPGFKFDTDPAAPFRPFGIENYEQVWLFGSLGQPSDLKPTELQKTAEFMNDGGGVFATGDHRDLGCAMCGEVPRVRSMRKWFFDPVPAGRQKAPDLKGPTRLDTLRQGRDAGFQSSDQSDDIPQEIRPKFFVNPDGNGAHPHPLLAYGTFAVTVLPDHMHEGECIIPPAEDLTATYKLDGADVDEYPELFDIKARVSPEVVAIATSAGGFVTDSPGTLPVEPRCFIVIAAYDGHHLMKSPKGLPAMLGRVVVDSSFHHFVNTNLNGLGSTDPNKKGFYDASGNPTQDYLAFKKYYRNIVTWLSPPPVQLSYYVNLLLKLRYASPLVEEIRANGQFTIEEILSAGAATRNVISDKFSAVEAILCAQSLVRLLPPTTQTSVKELISPSPPGTPVEHANLFLDSQVVLNTVLGSAILGLAQNLPEDAGAAGLALHEDEPLEKTILPLVAGGLKQGVGELAQILQASHQTFLDLAETLLAFE